MGFYMLEIKLMAIHETITEQRKYFGDVSDIVLRNINNFYESKRCKSCQVKYIGPYISG